MHHSDLQQISDWFNSYVATFRDIDQEGLKNILLKEEHTAKVLEAMLQICHGEGFSEEQTAIASATALLHDVGRFPQYRKWRTFRDSDSANHARLSVETVREHKVLQHLTKQDQLLIEEAVRFHNLLSMPAKLKSPTNLYLRLIRDADKLDIWRVFTDYFTKPDKERASAAGLGLQDQPTVSQECIDTLYSGKIIQLNQTKVLNDFRLLQISWVYDLNFKTTYRLLDQQGYLETLSEGFPEAPMLHEAIDLAKNHMKKMSCF